MFPTYLAPDPGDIQEPQSVVVIHCVLLSHLQLVYKSKARMLNQQLASRPTSDQDSVKLLLSLQECWENITVSL